MITQFNKVFLLRFLGYYLFFVGIVAAIFQFGPVAQVEFSYRTDQIIKGANDSITSVVDGVSGKNTQNNNQNQESTDGFGSIGSKVEDKVVPEYPDYGIVIPKISANAKVVAAVNPANETEYVKALQIGVAEALGSTPPGQPGNLFLFSHSTDAPWNIARYNAIFYLLRELKEGDKVIVFHKGIRFDYVVYDKVVTSPSDVKYLTNRYDKPVLTMQTCDPPGTQLKRLIVRAKLVGS